MKKHITAEDIEQYANASNDKDAIHLNDEAAVKAGYKRPIAHGMYIMGLAQSLYLIEHPSQWITSYQMKFQKPLLVDTIAIFQYKTCNKDCSCNIEVTVEIESGEVIASGIFTVEERSKW